MDRERLFEMITDIRREGLSRYISVQTNATLIDKAAIDFFLGHGVNLEVGIDGDEPTTQRNRPGIGPYFYSDIVRGVNLVLGSKGPFTATMCGRSNFGSPSSLAATQPMFGCFSVPVGA